MGNEHNADYGDVHSSITIHTSGHQIGQRNGWDFALTLLVIGAFLLALAMVLTFGVIVLQLLGEMIAWVLGAL